MITEKIKEAIAYVDALPASGWIRRALEIAIFGRFSICFSGEREGNAQNWSQAAGEFDLVSYFITPCPCGYLNHPGRGCVCSLDEIRRHYEEPVVQKAISADLYLEVVRSEEIKPSPDSFLVAYSRTQSAKLRSLPFSEDAQALLRRAVKMLKFAEARKIKTRQLATAIAALEGSAKVEAQHVAESLQYFPANPLSLS